MGKTECAACIYVCMYVRVYVYELARTVTLIFFHILFCLFSFLDENWQIQEKVDDVCLFVGIPGTYVL